VKYCNKCLMPDTRPGSIFNSNGNCQACLNFEIRQKVDWNIRLKKLDILCDKYRRSDAYYDCIIPVSGGKDSHFITHIMKEKMGMNPLLICVADPFTHTAAGSHNLKNLGEAFNCDIITFNLSIDLFRRVTRIGFAELGEPLRFIEAAIYTVPFNYAVAFNIPLVVWGENAAFHYGTTSEDGYSVKRFIEAGHSASGQKLSEKITDFWAKRGILLKEMNAIIPPSQEQLKKVKPEPVFMGYFVPWDDENNLAIARRYGFKDLHHEWKREGCVEDYAQIDSLAYFVHLWMKYPKFGFSRTTDIVSRWIRKGKITRDEGKVLVKQHDHKLDQRSLDDFVHLMGYTSRQFWDIVEPFWNRKIFTNIKGEWKLKNPVYGDIK
jgi:N-acetyl sugar amidotransferase